MELGDTPCKQEEYPSPKVLSPAQQATVESSGPQKKKTRCACCRKASFLLVECSMCHNHFCVPDRLPESHACQQIQGYKDITIDLVKIAPSKIDHL